MDSDTWEFDVFTSPHDDVKRGVTVRRWSRVLVSRDEFPDSRVASQVAACMAVAIHGGMPTSILPRL
jgi:hypothetical protein